MQTDTERTIEECLKKGESHDDLNVTSYYFDRSLDQRTSNLAVQPELGLLSERRSWNSADCADCFDGVGADLMR